MMKQLTGTKILSFILAIIMIFGLLLTLPATAYGTASNTEESPETAAATEAASSGISRTSDFVLGADDAYVTTAAEFKTALQNASITTIYFGANIQLTSRVTIAQRTSGSLTIVGTDPYTGARYRYEDLYGKNSSTGQGYVSLYMASAALTKEIVFKDIDLLGYNIYGVVTFGSYINDKITIVFDGVEGTSNQFVASFASTFIIRDSKLTVNSSGGGYAEEVAEVTTLIFEGNVEINHSSNRSPSYAMFNFNSYSGKGEIIIRSDADVTLTSTNNSYGCFHFYCSSRTFEIEENATFTYVGRDRFSLGSGNGRLDSFKIGEGSEVTLIMPENGSQAQTPGGVNADAITVGEGASLSIFANSNNTTYLPMRTSTLTLDNPRRVVIYNAGTSNVIQSATTLNATKLQGISYYTTAGDSYDFESKAYNADRGDYKYWFFQPSSNFDVTASSWGAATAVNLSTSGYSGDTPLTGSTFGANGVKVIQIDGNYSTSSAVASVSLIPENNTAKTYSTDTLSVGINMSGATDFNITQVAYVILDNPNAAFTVEDSDAFDAAYSGALAGKAGEVSVTKVNGSTNDYTGIVGEITYNCAVWVRATLVIDGETVEAYDTLSYRNLFTKYAIKARGVIAGSDPIDTLYDYQVVEGTYGIPYLGDGVTVYENPIGGFDDVILKIDDYLANHWTAQIDGEAIPYTLTLDQDFPTNTLCDDGDPESYTLDYTKLPGMWWENVTVYYYNESGTSVNVNGATSGTISVPLSGAGSAVSENFYELGGRYTPPSDDNNSPVGWFVSTAFENGTIRFLNDFSSSVFNPEFSDLNTENLYIIYKTGQFKVLEQYQDTDGAMRSQSKTLTFDASNPDNYVGTPAHISGYVPVEYTVSGSTGADDHYVFDFDAAYAGGASPADNQYTLFPRLQITGTALIPADSSGTVTITYIYAKDHNLNGIPDVEETSVTVRWRGYKQGNDMYAILRDSLPVYSRQGDYTLTITNQYPDDGVSDHKITLASGSNAGTWIFDTADGNNTASRTVTMDGGQSDVIFVYGYATDGENLDSLQYVDELYYIVASDDADGTQFDDAVRAATRTYLLKGETYTFTPPTIDGYVYYGYRLDSHDGGDNIPTYVNGETPAPITFETGYNDALSHTLTLLYREAAKPATITWAGATYAGSDVTFYTTVHTGYVGEQLDISHTAYQMGETWQLVSGDSFTIIFDADETVSHTFRYREELRQANITIRYETDDKSIDFTQTFKLLPNDDITTYVAFPLSNYEVTGVEVVGRYGVIYSGSEGSVAIDPKNGDQTVTFYYQSTNTRVYVNAYDENRMLMPQYSRSYSDAVIGKAYSAIAPAVENYSLQSGQSYTQAISSVASGVNNINFYYEPITGGTLILREAGDNGPIIAYRELGEVSGAEIDIPDLSDDYYTIVEGQEKQQYTADNSVITYYYTKDTRDITIQAVDEAGKPIKAVTYPGDARRGEMYTGYAIVSIPWYTLNDAERKTVYVDGDESDALVITFAYKADQEITTSSLVIQVTDSATGLAVSGASIMVKNAAGATVLEGQTDSGGKITFSYAAFDTYTITVTAAGYNSGTTTKEISALQPVASVHIALGTTTTGSGGSGGGSNKTAKLTVQGHNEDGTVLYAETTTRNVGDVVTVEARVLEGYKLSDDATKRMTIASNSGENLIIFHYTAEETTPAKPTYPQLETEDHIAYINGYEDGTVQPDNSITRAEVAMIIYRLIVDEGKYVPLTSSFGDVPAGAWYAQTIAYLEKYNILEGYQDGTFRPNNSITRAEFVTIASRLHDLQSGNKLFNDVADDHWAAAYIGSAVARGWVHGYPDGTFRPENNITRAEAVTIVNAMLNRKIHLEDIPADILQYSDMDEAHWAYSAIIEASAPHAYEREDDGYEIWTPTTNAAVQ